LCWTLRGFVFLLLLLLQSIIRAGELMRRVHLTMDHILSILTRFAAQGSVKQGAGKGIRSAQVILVNCKRCMAEEWNSG
jgi:hypothetical protein